MAGEPWIERARELAERFAGRAALHDRDASFPFENFTELHEAGFLALTIPRTMGGAEASMGTFLRVQEELARGDGSTALCLNMHLVRFGGARYGGPWPEAWIRRFAEGAIEHGWLLNTAATEVGLGSPAGGGLPDTTARPDGEYWILDGRKTFTTGAPALRYFVTLATMPPGEDDRPSLGEFVVVNDDPGVSIERNWDALGMRATESHDLVLDGVRLPGDRLLSSRPVGERNPRASALGAWFALGVAATTLGIARAARDHAVAYARTRTPNSSRTIREFPGVRSRVARIELLLQRSRALLDDAAGAWERRDDPADGEMSAADRVAIAKVDTMNNCIEAVELAMRVVGGVGLRTEETIERYYRDVRVCLHNPPLEDRALEQLARSSLDD